MADTQQKLGESDIILCPKCNSKLERKHRWKPGEKARICYRPGLFIYYECPACKRLWLGIIG